MRLIAVSASELVVRVYSRIRDLWSPPSTPPFAKTFRGQSADSQPPKVRIGIGFDEKDARVYYFTKSLLIGRDNDCEISFKHDYLSRHHASVLFEDGVWRVEDMDSANGIYVNGRRVRSVRVKGRLSCKLGLRGPTIWIEPELAAPLPRENLTSIQAAKARYFSRSPDDIPMSERTIFIRQAFAQVHKKQRSRNWLVVAASLMVIVAVSGYEAYRQHQWNQRRESAEALFYSMKALELELTKFELRFPSADQNAERARQYREKKEQMQLSYDRYVREMHLSAQNLSEEDRLLLRVTRIFGECDLNMPPEFAAEVKTYIQQWKTSNRLRKAIETSRANGYARRIAEEFLTQGLPPQFFYLALQESDFNAYAVGTPTRMGIAKGMWQFIPRTATQYGLRVGPLDDLTRPDPSDDRNKWERATVAAARYIKDLYASDAQSSGLLVMACYNWGEDNVLPLVRSMPANPRDRNFWRLLREHGAKLPKETHDYVFYIISAAVIGENPRLFGFDFDNPLSHLDQQAR